MSDKTGDAAKRIKTETPDDDNSSPAKKQQLRGAFALFDAGDKELAHVGFNIRLVKNKLERNWAG